MADASNTGGEMYGLVERLYPLIRSITGDGVRETFRLVGEVTPLEVHEVPTGTQVLDWTVPPEWNVREAWVKDPSGQVVVDVRDLNLHLFGYSIPIHERVPLERLQEHLHSLPEQPDLVPWRNSYYEEAWGFCLADRVRRSLPQGEYEVCIDTSLEPGSLTYAECVVPGRTDREVLITAHTCHPALANDNLSGIAVAAYLARTLRERGRPRYTYRFLFAPGTIGAITWLGTHQQDARRIDHGLVLSCLGDTSPFTYKRTFTGGHDIDRAVEQVLRERDAGTALDYYPYGYDERQYNSPGFRLPVGGLMRARHGTFPEYHTSADNLDFVSPTALEESLEMLTTVVDVIEGNERHLSLNPMGEPQLGRRGLFRSLGGLDDPAGTELALLWVLATADGQHDLLAVAERSGLRFHTVRHAATLLHQHDLVSPIER